MLEPKKIKYRRQQRARGRWKGMAIRGSQLAFGSIGLKAQTTGELTARQIEAARRAMSRAVARGGKIHIRVFPDIPVSQKAAEVPMGSGKGALDHYATVVKQGAILFEMDGVENEEVARRALELGGYKLPIKTKVVTRIAH